MKRSFPVIVIFICFTLWSTALWANILLKGQLVTDTNQPVPGTKIAVSGGPVDITDFNGNFQINLSNDFIEGERVIISVIKDGWVIDHPLDGEWNLPNIKYQRVHTTRVVIVPYGSMKLWSHARIEKHVAQLADELAKMKKESREPQPVDFSFYLKEWADRYGFTPGQVKAQFDRWAEEVKNSDNNRTLGLRAFYLKNFPQAAEYFTKDAQQWNARAKKIQDALWQAKKNEYESWKDAGNAYDAAYRFREALEAYQKAEEIATLEQYPRQWGEIRIYIGNAHVNLGIGETGEKSTILLSDAVSSYRLVLQRSTRQDAPQDWAKIQSKLGYALQEQGIRTEGAEGTALLGQAVQAYQKALEIFTKEHLPQDWAWTQNTLGIVLSNQGIRTDGAEGAALLGQAVQAYQKALEIRTKEHLPQDWAKTQNNLGNALKEQGIRTGGAEGAASLGQAVQAYQKALEILTKEQLPQYWAGTQNNLGNALMDQGVRTGGAEGAALLKQAVHAFQKALEIYTNEQLPQDWARTQDNLGLALTEQGMRTGGAEGAALLAQAVLAYQKALEIYTQEQLPQDWARTQDNLGNALQEQGMRIGGAEGAVLLAQAVQAYQKALEIRTKEHLPQQWADTQNNLGTALQEQGIRTGGTEGAALLVQAVHAYQKALEIFTQEHLPYYWAETQKNLAELYESQENWAAAVQHYRQVYKVEPAYAANKLALLLHDRLFRFNEALEMNLYLVKPENNPTMESRLSLVENYFIAGLYSEGNRLIDTIKPGLTDPAAQGYLILLALFETCNWAGLDDPVKASGQLEVLVSLVKKQPLDFKLDREFPGCKYYIRTNPALASHREWLLQLFTALEKTGRDRILAELEKLKR